MVQRNIEFVYSDRCEADFLSGQLGRHLLNIGDTFRLTVALSRMIGEALTTQSETTVDLLLELLNVDGI